MNIIEQVKELRKIAREWEYNAPTKPIRDIFNEAADTIESLSKLQAENCGSKWIYCGDGKNLPKPGKRYQVTAVWKDGDFETQSVYDAVYGSDKAWHTHNYDYVAYEVIAWQPLPEPYHEP